MTYSIKNFLLKLTIYLIPLLLIWLIIGPTYTQTLLKLIQPLTPAYKTVEGHILYLNLDSFRVTMDFTSTHLLDFNLVPLIAIILATTARRKQKIVLLSTLILLTVIYHLLIILSRINTLINQDAIWQIIQNSQTILSPLILFISWYWLSSDISRNIPESPA